MSTCSCMQGALEVWDYSAEHLRRYAPLFVGRDVRFRHVPFTWFPLVCAVLLSPPPASFCMHDYDALFAIIP